MKAIVVEGFFDYRVLDGVFPEIKERGIMLKVAQGFSNVFAISKTLIDYGYEVLAMLDTDSDKAGQDNRIIVERLFAIPLETRKIDIVWMNPNIEKVLDRAVPNMGRMMTKHMRKACRIASDHKDAILELDEFKQIKTFCD